jgi:hypothetical protein
MRGRFIVWSAAVCAVALGCATGNQPSAASDAQKWRTLTNDRVGFSLSYPRAWHVTGKVVATQFSAGASCQTVRVVDHTSLSLVRQSYVQLCWKRITDGSSLAAFMRRTYGARLSSFFVRTRLGGGPAYRSRGQNTNRTFFVQTATYRIQIVAGVVASPARRPARLAQVNRILRSFTITS